MTRVRSPDSIKLPQGCSARRYQGGEPRPGYENVSRVYSQPHEYRCGLISAPRVERSMCLGVLGRGGSCFGNLERGSSWNRANLLCFRPCLLSLPISVYFISFFVQSSVLHTMTNSSMKINQLLFNMTYWACLDAPTPWKSCSCLTPFHVTAAHSEFKFLWLLFFYFDR